MSNQAAKVPSYRCYPHRDYPYFLCDPCDSTFRFYRTQAERDADASEIIDGFLDEAWDEDVVHVFGGTVTHVATECDRKERPETEKECDEVGWNSDFDYTVNYKLLPIESAEPVLK